MSSQRLLTFFLAILLVLSLVVIAAFSQQIGRLHQLQTRVENFEQEQAAERKQYEQQLEELQQQHDDVDATLSETETELSNLRSQFDQVERQRDQLQQERDQLQKDNEKLEMLLRNLNGMNVINDQVVGLRGLQPLSKVPRGVLTRQEYRERLVGELEQDFSAEDERRERAKLVALDMISPDEDLRSAIIDSQARSVLGFYDPRSKELWVISDRENLGVEDRITYAHEYVHSLQDQHFNLSALQESVPSTDASLALRALIEGDATISMYFWAQENLSVFDRVNYQLDQIDEFMNLFGSLNGSSADTVVESVGHFPYTYGADFVYGLYQAGRWRSINRAYSNPPRSTSQILHPELYYQGVQPVPIRLPDLQAALGPDWKLATSDVLGELYLRVYLEHEVQLLPSINAAAGWRGDRFAVLEGPDGTYALALRVAMANQREAAELFEAYTVYAEEKGGAPSTPFTAARRLWTLTDRQMYLARAGREVLILRAPDATSLGALRSAFPGF